MSKIHEYRSRLDWTGSTAGGVERYDREHRVSCPPAKAALLISSDPAFRGNPQLLNPEQLLLAAASSCQMLSFLAFAAREGIDVISYTDEAEAVMPEDDKPVRITRVLLRPRITIAGGVDKQRVRACVERAHEKCFIANSLKSSITIEPHIDAAETPVSV